jgi:hypothetical protein
MSSHLDPLKCPVNKMNRTEQHLTSQTDPLSKLATISLRSQTTTSLSLRLHKGLILRLEKLKNKIILVFHCVNLSRIRGKERSALSLTVALYNILQNDYKLTNDPFWPAVCFLVNRYHFIIDHAPDRTLNSNVT